MARPSLRHWNCHRIRVGRAGGRNRFWDQLNNSKNIPIRLQYTLTLRPILIERRLWHLTEISAHRMTTALELALCWRHQSSWRQRRTAATYRTAAENSCCMQALATRNGNQLGQQQTPRQQHQVMLYESENWTLTKDLGRRVQAFEDKCYRSMFAISYKDHKSNKYVWQQVSTDGRNVYCQPSSTTSYHGSVMSDVAIRYQPFYLGRSSWQSSQRNTA